MPWLGRLGGGGDKYVCVWGGHALPDPSIHEAVHVMVEFLGDCIMLVSLSSVLVSVSQHCKSEKQPSMPVASRFRFRI